MCVRWSRAFVGYGMAIGYLVREAVSSRRKS